MHPAHSSLAPVIDRAKALFTAVTKHTSTHGACLSAAACVVAAAAEFGFPVVFCAGSFSWRFVAPNLDDGKSATGFGFQWDPASPLSAPFLDFLRRVHKSPLPQIASLLSSNNGSFPLPEVHCWAVILCHDEMLVVDMITGSLPVWTATLGHWSMPPPPDCFIGTPDPENVYYEAHSEPTFLLLRIALAKLYGHDPQLAKSFANHVSASSRLFSTRRNP